MFAVVVTFEIKEDDIAAFMPLILENARVSQIDEEGCLQFDVCVDPENPKEVFLYEVYTDRAAFDAHMQTAHFADFADKADKMIADKTVKLYSEVLQ